MAGVGASGEMGWDDGSSIRTFCQVWGGVTHLKGRQTVRAALSTRMYFARKSIVGTYKMLHFNIQMRQPGRARSIQSVTRRKPTPLLCTWHPAIWTHISDDSWVLLSWERGKRGSKSSSASYPSSTYKICLKSRHGATRLASAFFTHL